MNWSAISVLIVALLVKPDGEVGRIEIEDASLVLIVAHPLLQGLMFEFAAPIIDRSIMRNRVGMAYNESAYRKGNNP